MKSRLWMVALFLAVSANAFALAPADIDGTWYRWVHNDSQQFRNSHYSLVAYTFNMADKSWSRLALYPSASVRTELRKGSFEASQNGTSVRVQIREQSVNSARLLAKSVAWPIPSLVDVKEPVRSSLSYMLDVNERSGALLIGTDEYRNLADELARISLSDDASAARDFLRLSFLQVFEVQACVPGLGTAAMLGIDKTMKGDASGSLRVSFDGTSLLSGGTGVVRFDLSDFSNVPGISVDGSIIAGTDVTTGQITLFAVTKGKRTPLGVVTMNRILLKEAVSVGGTFLVAFYRQGKKGSAQSVPFNALPD